MTLRAASCVLFALVFATNAFGQNLLWETIADLSGGTDIARAITLSKNAAVVIGNASNTQDEVNDFVVSALRRKDGATTWTDHVPTDSNVLGLQIASAAGRVFASGYAPPAAGFGSDIVVRGYDALSGALLWSSVWDEGRDDLPQALVAGPSAVVVVGYGGNTPGQNVSFLVRAYDPASGAVLWDDRVQRSANGTAAWQVAVARNRVFVAGNVLESGANALIVRAYNAASGTLAWEMSRPATSPLALKAVGPRVLLAGLSSGAGYLGAFDAGSGALLWEDQVTEPSSFRDLAVEGNRAVVVGSAGGAVLVRSYDVTTGSIQWDQRSTPGPDTSEFATTVAVNGRSVYVGGAGVGDFVYSEILVRAHDAATGALLWDDRSHRSTRPALASATDLALGKNRLFVAGYGSGVGTDFIIRAYDIRGNASSAKNTANR